MTPPRTGRPDLTDRLGRLKRGTRWMAVSWLVFTVVALIDVVPSILAARSGSEGPSAGQFLRRWSVTHLSVWYMWWLLSPLVFWLAERYRPRARAWLRWAGVHTAAALVISYVGGWAMTAVLSWFIQPARYSVLPIVGFLQYGAILGVATMVGMQRRERDNAVASARLAAELAEARAEAVSSRLRPHFLYNALNSIAMLIRARANDAALEAVLGYSELLREAVETTSTDIPLREEIGLIEKYVAIERMRFPDSFSATMVVTKEAADAVVPSFILQPIVENALRHGLSALDRDALLEVRASRRDANVHLEVRDNGVGLPPHWRLERGSGVGLRTTRSRLQQRYGTAFHFELHSPAEGGTVVIVEVPYSKTPPLAVS
jgi:signal transduction histidine kinase